jgi:hypothetical protein
MSINSVDNIDYKQLEELKKKLEKQKEAQKIASQKYYQNKKDTIKQKVKEYKDKKKEPKEPKELTPDQQKKREYNKRYQNKLKEKKRDAEYVKDELKKYEEEQLNEKLNTTDYDELMYQSIN